MRNMHTKVTSDISPGDNNVIFINTFENHSFHEQNNQYLDL